jgi:uncharacterized repeat protein (TIGR03803 family)/VCBS repeat-containing protein
MSVRTLVQAFTVAVALVAPTIAASQTASEKTLVSLSKAYGPQVVVQAGDGNYYIATSSSYSVGGGGWNPITNNPIGAPQPAPAASVLGTLLQVTPAGVETQIATFQDQKTQITSLIAGIDGNFYGTSSYGGADSFGYLFRVTPSGAVTDIYDFTGGQDQGRPTGMIQASDGTFYGGTSYGSAVNAFGTVFHYSLSTGLETLYSFTGGNDGSQPQNIVQGSDGTFYGAAYYGGANGDGTVFKMTPEGSLSAVYAFTDNDGSQPFSLAEGKDGNFYGELYASGPEDDGSFFEVTPTGAETVLSYFTQATGWNNYPMVAGSDGNFYTLTGGAGANNASALVQMTRTGTINPLLYYPTTQPTNYSPDSLVQGDDGNFYSPTPYVTDLVSGIGESAVVVASPSPALAPPVQVTLSASSISLGDTVALSWNVLNAYSLTGQTCVATAPAGAGTWNGVQTGMTSESGFGGTALVTPTEEGVFTYALTCGGVESGLATLTVGNASEEAINLSSVGENFGDVAEGKSATQTITVTNDTGAAFPFAIAQYGDANFSEADTCTPSIAKKKSCKITITYASPVGTDETDAATFVIASNGASFVPGNSIEVAATSVPTGKVKLSATSHNFGKVKAGTVSSYALNVTNNANGPVQLTYSAGTVPSQYTVSNECPATLAAGDTCVVTFTFTPTDTTTQSLTFTVTPASPDVTAGSITLTGN